MRVSLPGTWCEVLVIVMGIQDREGSQSMTVHAETFLLISSVGERFHPTQPEFAVPALVCTPQPPLFEKSQLLWRNIALAWVGMLQAIWRHNMMTSSSLMDINYIYYLISTPRKTAWTWNMETNRTITCTIGTARQQGNQRWRQTERWRKTERDS